MGKSLADIVEEVMDCSGNADTIPARCFPDDSGQALDFSMTEEQVPYLNTKMSL